MKTEKIQRWIVFAILAVWLVPAELTAQKVYKRGDSFYIEFIDGWMPENVVITDQPITEVETNKFKVYRKLEIAPTNEGDKGPWSEADAMCKGKDGGTWRLPTRLELRMIYGFREVLEKRLGFSMNFSMNVDEYLWYWSYTGGPDEDTYWFIGGLGGEHVEPGSLSFFTRCVREVPPTP